ncbi:MAG: hypothetical protein M1492_01575 [Gammaproteobacteria bacterium]|jgi:hypothetical protein|nr:hypothetical protein [Gammaproteobacteria bacterium]
MLGNLKKADKVFPIIEFRKPDTLLLRGSFVEFETSLRKSRKNGYALKGCDEPELLQAWEEVP